MIYEVGYLIIPTIGEESLAPEVSKLKDILAEALAKVITDEYPALISLQYEMTKRIETKNVRFNQAYFGWIKFEVEADALVKIKKQLDLHKNLLRYIIISTVRENTLSSKKPLVATLASRSYKTPRAEVEETLPIDEEAVDQEIDRLVEDVDVVEDAVEEIVSEEK